MGIEKKMAIGVLAAFVVPALCLSLISGPVAGTPKPLDLTGTTESVCYKYSRTLHDVMLKHCLQIAKQDIDNTDYSETNKEKCEFAVVQAIAILNNN